MSLLSFLRASLTAAIAAASLTGCGVYLAPSTKAHGTAAAWTIAPADLRFKGVGQSLQLTPVLTSGLPSFASAEYSGAYAMPLELGGSACNAAAQQAYTCSWNYSVAGSATSTPLTTRALFLSDPISELAAPASPWYAVVDSLDIQSSQTAFALSATSTTAATFLPMLQHLPIDSLSDFAAQAGASGQVATAIGLDSATTAYLYLYGWQSDTTSHYETSVVSGNYDTLIASATMLAQHGYVITASGGNNTAGLILIGTRLAGTSTTRTLTALSGTAITSQALKLLSSGTALVAVIDGPTAGEIVRLYEN
jgi:hypothetical protein